MLTKVDIDNIYTNLLLISISRQCDFVKLVNETDDEIKQIADGELSNIKGYVGLYFLELLARKMGSNIGEAYGLTAFQQNTIVTDILRSINLFSDAYSSYYDDSCEDNIEFQGIISVLATKDRDELQKYYYRTLAGEPVNNVYTYYKITFQKFMNKAEDIEYSYCISISGVEKIKSEYMYEFFDIWAGNEGEPADFIERVIADYKQKHVTKKVEDEIVEPAAPVPNKCTCEVEMPMREVQELSGGRECVEELIEYVFDNTRTIDLLDKFEGYEQQKNIIYKRLVIKNGKYNTLRNGEIITFNLVIERGRGTDYVGDVTFTQFKKGEAYELKKHIDAELTDELITQYKDKDQFYRFSRPYLLRAQNSSNRTGYGWEWDWSGGYGDYTEGTLYGETTNYFFVGVYVTSGFDSYKPGIRKPFISEINEEPNMVVINNQKVIFYSGKLNLLTRNKVVQRFLKIRTESKGDKYIPVSIDEEAQIVYISEAVCTKYKDKIISGKYEMKKNFID